MPKISLAIHTASPDFFLKNQGVHSYFKALLHNLSKQSFQDFELIYIDTFFENNQKHHQECANQVSFQVKHVPIHPNHRYWYDLGYVFISAAKNTGILYADGELIISCDDAEFMPDHLLETYWKHYQDGKLMHAVHKRLKSIKIENGLPTLPIEGDIYINDHRLNTAKKQISYHQHGTLTFAGTSFSLKDALHLNGFNERMDSCKSLEDCDFGMRLVMIGKEFALDTEGYLYILDHQSYADAIDAAREARTTDCQVGSPDPIPLQVKKIENLIAIENYGMLCCSKELMEPQANKFPITEKHLKIIQRETIKYRGFDPLSAANKEKFDLWSKTPTFNLKQERAILRKSKDWKWK